MTAAILSTGSAAADLLRSSEPSADPVIGKELTPTAAAAHAVLQEAVRRNPDRALFWSRLATCRISDYKNRWNEAGREETEAGKDLVHRAREALAQADAIDPNLGSRDMPKA